MRSLTDCWDPSGCSPRLQVVATPRQEELQDKDYPQKSPSASSNRDATEDLGSQREGGTLQRGTPRVFHPSGVPGGAGRASPRRERYSPGERSS